MLQDNGMYEWLAWVGSRWWVWLAWLGEVALLVARRGDHVGRWRLGWDGSLGG